MQLDTIIRAYCQTFDKERRRRGFLVSSSSRRRASDEIKRTVHSDEWKILFLAMGFSESALLAKSFSVETKTHPLVEVNEQAARRREREREDVVIR